MANGDNINIWGLTHNALPGATVDNQYGQVRSTQYGELATVPLLGAKNHLLSVEGSYYTICNPTAGTAIADGNASGFVTTTPLLVVYNGNASGGKSIYMDYLDLIVTAAAGTSSTNFVAAHYVDTGNRWSSGGSAITPANVNPGSSLTSAGVVHFGAITATAANAQRQLHNEILRTVIPVIGDKYKFRYGDTVGATAGMPLEGTTQLERVVSLPGIVIPPQCSYCLYTWGASQGTARQHTFTGAYWER